MAQHTAAYEYDVHEVRDPPTGRVLNALAIDEWRIISVFHSAITHSYEAHHKWHITLERRLAVEEVD